MTRLPGETLEEWKARRAKVQPLGPPAPGPVPSVAEFERQLHATVRAARARLEKAPPRRAVQTVAATRRRRRESGWIKGGDPYAENMKRAAEQLLVVLAQTSDPVAVVRAARLGMEIGGTTWSPMEPAIERDQKQQVGRAVGGNKRKGTRKRLDVTDAELQAKFDQYRDRGESKRNAYTLTGRAFPHPVTRKPMSPSTVRDRIREK